MIILPEKRTVKEKNLEVMRNPELDEEFQAHAFSHSGMSNWEEEPILRVNERGFPVENINKEAYANDYAGYWKMHEQKLWFVLGIGFLLK